MDLRKERTLKLLANAFQELMHEQGYNGITVSQLCDRAMIRRATFYRHFSGKEDYLKYFVRSRRGLANDHVLAGGDMRDYREYCRRMTDQLIDLAIEHRELLEKLRLDEANAVLLLVLSREVASELCDALLQNGAYADVEPADERRRRVMAFASFYATGLFGVLDRALVSDETLERENLAAQFAVVLDSVDFPALAVPAPGGERDGHS